MSWREKKCWEWGKIVGKNGFAKNSLNQLKRKSEGNAQGWSGGTSRRKFVEVPLMKGKF